MDSDHLYLFHFVMLSILNDISNFSPIIGNKKTNICSMISVDCVLKNLHVLTTLQKYALIFKNNLIILNYNSYFPKFYSIKSLSLQITGETKIPFKLVFSHFYICYISAYHILKENNVFFS